VKWRRKKMPSTPYTIDLGAESNGTKLEIVPGDKVTFSNTGTAEITLNLPKRGSDSCFVPAPSSGTVTISAGGTDGPYTAKGPAGNVDYDYSWDESGDTKRGLRSGTIKV
jgi:hypothetical protein